MTAQAETPATATSAPPPAAMFHTIDGLRGIGVIGVMLAHFPGVPIDQVMPGIYLVVDMFYLISGFVLSHAYQHRLGHQIGAKQFMQMRMIRIYPLYLLALGLSVTAHLVISWRTGLAEPLTLAVSIVASILILPLSKELAYRHHHPFPFNGASWTLFWEILINLVWAALGPRLGNRLLGLFVAVGIVLLMVAAALPTGFTGGGRVCDLPSGRAAGGVRFLCRRRRLPDLAKRRAQLAANPGLGFGADHGADIRGPSGNGSHPV